MGSVVTRRTGNQRSFGRAKRCLTRVGRIPPRAMSAVRPTAAGSSDLDYASEMTAKVQRASVRALAATESNHCIAVSNAHSKEPTAWIGVCRRDLKCSRMRLVAWCRGGGPSPMPPLKRLRQTLFVKPRHRVDPGRSRRTFTHSKTVLEELITRRTLFVSVNLLAENKVRRRSAIARAGLAGAHICGERPLRAPPTTLTRACYRPTRVTHPLIFAEHKQPVTPSEWLHEVRTRPFGVGAELTRVIRDLTPPRRLGCARSSGLVQRAVRIELQRTA